MVVAAFAAVAALLLVVGIVLLVSSIRFVSSSETASGTVVEVSAEQRCKTRDGRRECRDTYRPTVTYTTAAGEEVTFTSNGTSSDWNFPVGSTVTVRYAPDNPQGARLDGWFSLWGAPTIVGGLGVVFSVVALILRFALLRGPGPGASTPLVERR